MGAGVAALSVLAGLGAGVGAVVSEWPSVGAGEGGKSMSSSSSQCCVPGQHSSSVPGMDRKQNPGGAPTPSTFLHGPEDVPRQSGQEPASLQLPWRGASVGADVASSVTLGVVVGADVPDGVESLSSQPPVPGKLSPQHADSLE